MQATDPSSHCVWEIHLAEKLLCREAGNRDQEGVVVVDQWFSPCS